MKKVFLVLVSAVTLASAPLFAKNDGPSKEDRAKMADAHVKMADCLKSDKSMKDCHKEMMSACEGMGKKSCHMMGGMMGRRMIKGHMMDGEMMEGGMMGSDEKEKSSDK